MLCRRIARRETGYQCCYITAVFFFPAFLFFSLQVTPSVSSQEMLLEVHRNLELPNMSNIPQSNPNINQVFWHLNQTKLCFLLLLISVIQHWIVWRSCNVILEHINCYSSEWLASDCHWSNIQFKNTFKSYQSCFPLLSQGAVALIDWWRTVAMWLSSFHTSLEAKWKSELCYEPLKWLCPLHRFYPKEVARHVRKLSFFFM